MSYSTLPPLKGDKHSLIHIVPSPTNTRSNSSLSSSQCIHCGSSRIIYEINSLFQRLDNCEKDITELRVEIPPNFTSKLENLEMASKTYDFNSDITDNFEVVGEKNSSINSNIIQQLDSFEAELTNDIQTQFLNNDAYIKDKIDKILSRLQKFNNKGSQNNMHIPRIDELLNDVRKKEQANIENLEKNLEKLKKYVQPIEKTSYSEYINSNSLQIQELQAKLTLISSQLDAHKEYILKNTNQSFKNQINNVYREFNDTRSNLENTYNNMNQFTKTFKDALQSSQNKAKECEKRIKDAEQIINKLSSSIQIIESKLETENDIILNLFQKMENLDQLIKNKSEDAAILMLAEEIRIINLNMRSVISSIKEKVRKCELSVPLI